MGRRSNATLVEIDAGGLRWAKSSASDSGGSSCLEVALADDVVLLRDSRNRAGARLSIPAVSWADFLGRTRG
ncbi:MAG TPA: DUF397 domain-containing protein [Pseudonocardiaceae bacterium]|jgi:hypothetical protein|nr:DUF397 domain-containing protein [Pseudonocardiaceae bacterium]